MSPFAAVRPRRRAHPYILGPAALIGSRFIYMQQQSMMIKTHLINMELLKSFFSHIIKGNNGFIEELLVAVMSVSDNYLPIHK